MRPFALMALVALAGCRPSPPPAPLDAALVGQREIVRDGHDLRRVFDRQRIPTLRLPKPAALSATWSGGDREVPLTPTTPHAVGSEVVVRLEPASRLPPGPGVLRVESADGRRRHWVVRWAIPPAERAGRTAIRALWKGRPPRHDDALAMLQSFGADAPVDRAWAYAERARIADRQGRVDDAIAGMVAAADAYEGAGHVSMAAARHLLAARYAIGDHRLGAASGHVDRGCALADAIGDEENRGRCAMRRVAVEGAVGRLRSAEVALREAELVFGRAALPGQVYTSRHVRANLLGRMGRHADALAVFDALVELHADDVELVSNHAWARLIAMQAGAVTADFGALATQFAALFERLPEGAPPASQHNLLANRATAALLVGRIAEARDALARARGLGYRDAYAALLGGEIALRSAEFERAAQLFTTARRESEEQTGMVDTADAWQAVYGLGRVARARGDSDTALAQWQSALTMARRLARRVALSTGHSAFLADRRSLVTDLVGLLLEMGRVGDAFRVSDMARAPTLRVLATGGRVDRLEGVDRAEWLRRVERWQTARQRAAEAEGDVELAPADARAAAMAHRDTARRAARARFDEAFAWLDDRAPIDDEDPGDPRSLLPSGMALMAFDHLGDRWHSFLVAGGEVSHRIMTSDARDTIPEDWRRRLDGIRRLYVIEGGLPIARDLAQWPVTSGGPVWGEAVEVVYIPHARWLGGSSKRPAGQPLIVADPDGTLPGSRSAAMAIARRAGVEPLVGASATRDAVLARLDGASWMHFDGHGVLGRGRPWQAHLIMAGGERLTLVDVLTRRPRVGTVVLSGCETGVPEALSRAEALGLAEGFLLAGADAVLAADRLLGVGEAARFVDAFYSLGGPDRPAAALRETIARLRADGDDAWRGWRLFGARPRGNLDAHDQRD